MTITLKDFLQEQAAKEQARSQAAQAEIDDWRSSAERLYSQFRIWLTDSDPNGIIKIEEREHEVSEEGLGVYRVPRLDLHAFGKSVAIIPKVIHSVGTVFPPNKSLPERASGRIDITDEIRRYLLYLYRDADESDIWMILDPRLAGRAREKELTKEEFEAALMSFFR